MLQPQNVTRLYCLRGMMVDLEFWQAIHAALLKQAHDLQEQRASVLQQAAAIEKQFGLKRNAVTKLEVGLSDSVAGYVSILPDTK